MKTKQTPEIIATRAELDRLVALAPEKSYTDCTPEERKRFDDVEAALQRHHEAVRAARRVKWTGGGIAERPEWAL